MGYVVNWDNGNTMANDCKGPLQLFERLKTMGNLTTELQWL